VSVFFCDFGYKSKKISGSKIKETLTVLWNKLNMFRNLSKNAKIILAVSAAFEALVVLPLISWIITDQGITATSDATFCFSCYRMEPFKLKGCCQKTNILV